MELIWLDAEIATWDFAEQALSTRDSPFLGREMG